MTATLTPRAKDGFWLILHRQDGKTMRVSTGTTDRREAERQLSEWNALRHPKHPVVQRIAALEAQTRGETPANMHACEHAHMFTLSDAFDAGIDDPRVWKGAANTKVLDSDLRSIRALIVPPSTVPLGDEPIESFTTRRLEAIYQHLVTAPRETMDGKPLGVGTARKHLGRITQVCDAAHRWWTDAAGNARLAVMPVRPRMERGEGRKRVVEASEEALIFDAIQHHIDNDLPGGDWVAFQSLVRFCIEHGVRREEALFVGPDALSTVTDPESGTVHQAIRLQDWWTKAGTGGRTFIVARSFLPLIDDLNASAETTTMTKIVGGKKRSSTAKRWFPMTGDKAGKMWSIMRDYVLVEHGVDLGKGRDGLSLHNLRHTAATRLIEGGASLYDVQTHLGHTSITVTQAYVHADKSAARRIAAVRDRAA